jgi:xanthine dehydrogenase accessory factor
MNDETLRTAELWRARGDDVALATVVRTRRSAPRPLGSKFAISSRGEMAGSVSGGCVEGAVYEEAQAILAGASPKLLYYGIADDFAWDVGLACGGELWVWLEVYRGWPAPDGRAARVTVVEGDSAGASAVVDEDGAIVGELPQPLRAPALEAAREAIARERNATVEGEGGTLFVEALVPRPRLVIVGAVDTAEALAGMAGKLGWRTAVIDPRARFATAERLPSADELVVRWPEQGYDEIDLRPQDAVVVLTHDPKLDDPAIRGALARGVGYVGALGSRRTQEKRNQRLREAGVAEAEIARVAGPVGLDIGAITPEETAVSILAEAIAFRAGREGGRLARSSGRIHPVEGGGAPDGRTVAAAAREC